MCETRSFLLFLLYLSASTILRVSKPELSQKSCRDVSLNTMFGPRRYATFIFFHSLYLFGFQSSIAVRPKKENQRAEVDRNSGKRITAKSDI